MIEDNFSLISLIFFSRIIQKIFDINLSKSLGPEGPFHLIKNKKVKLYLLTVNNLHGLGNENVRMVPCVKGDENQQWIHTKQGRLIHKVTNKCLDAGTGENMEDLHAGTCKASTSSQIWFFDVYHDV